MNSILPPFGDPDQIRGAPDPTPTCSCLRPDYRQWIHRHAALVTSDVHLEAVGLVDEMYDLAKRLRTFADANPSGGEYDLAVHEDDFSGEDDGPSIFFLSASKAIIGIYEALDRIYLPMRLKDDEDDEEEEADAVIVEGGAACSPRLG